MMRVRISIFVAALLLSSSAGMAQTQGATPTSGLIDIGFRPATVTGDAARQERYRDLRDGAASQFWYKTQTSHYALEARATNVGYRDQRYTFDFADSKLSFSALFDSIPLNYSYLTLSPWTSNGSGVLTLSDAARAAVQAGSAVGVPCSAGGPPATCNNAANADLAKANRSIFSTLARPFDLEAKRQIVGFTARYQATRETSLNLAFSTNGRKGSQPRGASFAFSNSVEVPVPIDERTNDASAAVEWSAPQGMFRIGWDGSWYNEHIPSLTWDNPIRLTDFNNGLLPPNGPYDSSAYSNGNGPAQGRMSLPPSNRMNVFGVTGLFKVTPRTNLNGTFRFTTMDQNQPLIPWTINSVINSPEVFAAFPELASLPRSTAQAQVRGYNFLLNFNSRPFDPVRVNVRYRVNEHDNYTPAFDAKEYVRFDAVPEENEEGITIQYDTNRQTLDANVSFALSPVGSLRLGYGRDAFDRSGRGYANVADNTFRVAFDSMQNRYVSLRTSFDHSQRRGSGFVLVGVDYEVGPGGTQPSLRYYDESDRDQDRASVILSVNPTDMIDLSMSVVTGRQHFMPDTFEGRLDPFGLLDSDVTSWNVGAGISPSEKVRFGASYGHDEYKSLQQSRNASPPPSPTWTDPAYDWTLNNNETVKNVNVYLDLNEAITRTDVNLSYDRSESDNAFIHGGPRVASLTAVGQFIPLPDVTNAWQTLKADVDYYFTTKVGVGFAYWYEKLDVTDYSVIDSNGPVGFSTVAGQPVATTPTGQPRVDWLGGLMLGYGARPYEGSTGFVRLLYRF